MKQLDGSYIPPKSGKARQLVIFLHGYGSNGDDLIGIGDQWKEGLQDTAFVAPNAPDMCEAFAAGFQWFPIKSADGTVTKTHDRKEYMEQATAALNPFIDAQLEKWGVEEKNLLVAGFSQGAMMAMYAMPRRKKPCAGIIGYSGMLMDTEGLKSPQIARMPVLIVHGGMDTVVPPDSLESAAAGFTAADFEVETILRPHLAHSIDNFGLIRGLEFTRECFGITEKTAEIAVKAKL